MEDLLVKYRVFNELDAATEFAEWLDANGFEYDVVDNSSLLDNAYFGHQDLNKSFVIRIRPQDFSEVDKLLEQSSQAHLEQIESAYLNDFSDEELEEILYKKDEWSVNDYLSSRKILASRGKKYTDQALEDLHRKRLEELRAPEKVDAVWLFFGFFSSFIGGLLGIIIGHIISNQKKTLPSGEQVFSYTLEDRIRGRWMKRIGVVIFVASSIFSLLMSSSLL